MCDFHGAASEGLDSIHFTWGYAICRLRPVNSLADFGRKDELPSFLRRIHAAIVGAGVVFIAKVPSFDISRVRNEMKRRSQSRNIFLSSALMDANFPTAINGFEGEDKSVAKRALECFPGLERTGETNRCWVAENKLQTFLRDRFGIKQQTIKLVLAFGMNRVAARQILSRHRFVKTIPFQNVQRDAAPAAACRRTGQDARSAFRVW